MLINSAMSSAIVFDANAHPVHSVTVFQVNRADINRRINVDLKKGQNEVEIKNLPSALLPDSIRVDGIGAAVIFDVIYKAPQDKDWHDDEDSTGLVELRRKRAAIQRKVDTVEKQLTVLSGYAGSLKSQYTSSADLSEFLELYSTRLLALTEEKVILNEDLKQVDKDIRATAKEQQKDEESAKRGVKIVVVVLAENDGPAELSLSYAVGGASWTPLYDVRASIDNGGRGAKSKVSLHYRASITQSTAEDWANVRLTLSTASPQIGSEIPKLISHRLRQEYSGPIYRDINETMKNMSMSLQQAHPRFVTEEVAALGGLREEPMSDRFASKPLKRRTAKVADSGGQGFSSVFEIEGFSTIPSNTDSNESHKVTIAVLDLEDVSLKWIAVPKEIPSVFLQCQVRNTSEYTLLPGESSVFMNNNFVSKSRIPNVSPQENFLTSLGVDSSVRVTFTPPSQKVSNVSGGLFGTSTTTTTFSQRITVKNTRLITLNPLAIRDQFPVSDDSRIKVTLIQPPLPDASSITLATMSEVNVPNVRGGVVKARWQAANEDIEVAEANNQGFVEWLCQIEPSASLDLVTVWEVNVPRGLKWNNH